MAAPVTSISCVCGATIPVAAQQHAPLMLQCPSCGLPLKITPLQPTRRQEDQSDEETLLRVAPRDILVRRSQGLRRGHTLFRRDVDANDEEYIVRRRKHRHRRRRYRTKLVLATSGTLATLSLISLILATNVDERYYPFGISFEVMLLSPVLFLGLAFVLVYYFSHENPM